MLLWTAMLLVLALVPGCERRVTLNVDVASFLDAVEGFFEELETEKAA